jgi:hypothetical protein
MDNPTPENEGEHRQYRLSLDDQLNTIEQEARMILPGIQALFGFQLIAVFNQGFKSSLSQTEQCIHLVALLLIAGSAALVLAPAAYHRESQHQVSVHFINISSRFIAVAMIPLALGISLDIYVVTKVITGDALWSGLVAVGISLIYFGLWFVFPNLHRLRIRFLPVHEINPKKPSA